MKSTTPPFKVIGAPQISRWLEDHPRQVFEVVRDTYVAHGKGETVNPDSYFLRFPENKKDRIIALPASIEAEEPVTGIKWISSFPDNIHHGLDRASAVLIVNDRRTGYPLACLEGSMISAARTAAAAAVGARYLHPTPRHISCLGVVGCGLIAYQTVELLLRLGWQIDEVRLSDLSSARAAHFKSKCWGVAGRSSVSEVQQTIRGSDMILFATSATEPYITEAAWFEHAPTVLHTSLRDLAPELILSFQNVADDVDHCLKAQTSLHLAHLRSGRRDHIDGGIDDAIAGRIRPDAQRTRVFSPFGMGILDLALAKAILDDKGNQDALCLPDFFPSPYVS